MDETQNDAVEPEATEAPAEPTPEVKADPKPADDGTAKLLEGLVKEVAALRELATPKPEPKADDDTDYKAEFERTQAELTAARVETAIARCAGAAGVNLAAALDSATVRKALADIDVTDPEVVTTALKELAAKDDNAYLRAAKSAPTPPRATSSPSTTSTGAHRTYTREDFVKMSEAELISLKRNNPKEYQRLLVAER